MVGHVSQEMPHGVLRHWLANVPPQQQERSAGLDAAKPRRVQPPDERESEATVQRAPDRIQPRLQQRQRSVVPPVFSTCNVTQARHERASFMLLTI